MHRTGHSGMASASTCSSGITPMRLVLVALLGRFLPNSLASTRTRAFCYHVSMFTLLEETCPFDLCDGSGEMLSSEQVWSGEPHYASIGMRKCLCRTPEPREPEEEL